MPEEATTIEHIRLHLAITGGWGTLLAGVDLVCARTDGHRARSLPWHRERGPRISLQHARGLRDASRAKGIGHDVAWCRFCQLGSPKLLTGALAHIPAAITGRRIA